MTLTGNWKGHFTYGPDYGENICNEKVEFLLRLTSNGDEFEGTSVDIDGVGANYETANIKGFIADEFISFTKQYPINYQIDNKLTMVEDASRPSPEIHYSGYFNSSKKVYSGEWEMTNSSFQYGYGCVVETSSGIWEMQKEE